MAAAPWYLLAIGLILVVIGVILAGLSNAGRSRKRGIDPRMRDDEIIRNLQDGSRLTFANIVIFLGLMCCMVGTVWRLVRFFVR